MIVVINFCEYDDRQAQSFCQQVITRYSNLPNFPEAVQIKPFFRHQLIPFLGLGERRGPSACGFILPSPPPTVVPGFRGALKSTNSAIQ